MDVNAVKAMLDKDRAEWEALVAALEARPEESLHEPGSPPWTSRDVYAHLARWMGVSTDHLGAQLEGRAFTRIEGTDDEINARWQQEDSGLSLEEARQRARAAFERRVRAIKAVPVDRLQEEAAEALARADGAQHYASHRRYIVA